MQFMKRDFSAIMRLGMAFISASDNPQNVKAAQTLVYAFKPFVPEDQIESVLLLANHIDFDTAAVAVVNLGEEEYDWATDLIYRVATVDSEMNQAQQQLWERLEDIYWEYQEPDDNGAYDAYA